MRKFLLLAVVGLAGCVTNYSLNRDGLEALKRNDNTTAYNSFKACAEARQPPCIHNLGYMVEYGRLTFPEIRSGQKKPLDIAKQYYWQAARFGYEPSQNALRRLGSNVPAVDLLHPSQQALQDWAGMMAVLGVVAAASKPGRGGASGDLGSGSFLEADKPKQTARAGEKCVAQADCGIGLQCVKINPMLSYSSGLCASTSEPDGRGRECSVTKPCASGWRCTDIPGELTSICLKP